MPDFAPAPPSVDHSLRVPTLYPFLPETAFSVFFDRCRFPNRRPERRFFFSRRLPPNLNNDTVHLPFISLLYAHGPRRMVGNTAGGQRKGQRAA